MPPDLAATSVMRARKCCDRQGHEGLIILISLDFRRFYAKGGKP